MIINSKKGHAKVDINDEQMSAIMSALAVTTEQVSELFLDYEHGMKRVELAFKYHVHIDTIDKWLRDYKKGKIEWLER